MTAVSTPRFTARFTPLHLQRPPETAPLPFQCPYRPRNETGCCGWKGKSETAFPLRRGPVACSPGWINHKGKVRHGGWRVSKKGHRYLVIDQLVICVVIERTGEGYWTWEIRWQDGRHPTRSKWTFPQQGDTFDEALGRCDRAGVKGRSLWARLSPSGQGPSAAPEAKPPFTPIPAGMGASEDGRRVATDAPKRTARPL